MELLPVSYLSAMVPSCAELVEFGCCGRCHREASLCIQVSIGHCRGIRVN